MRFCVPPVCWGGAGGSDMVRRAAWLPVEKFQALQVIGIKRINGS